MRAYSESLSPYWLFLLTARRGGWSIQLSPISTMCLTSQMKTGRGRCFRARAQLLIIDRHRNYPSADAAEDCVWRWHHGRVGLKIELQLAWKPSRMHVMMLPSAAAIQARRSAIWRCVCSRLHRSCGGDDGMLCVMTRRGSIAVRMAFSRLVIVNCRNRIHCPTFLPQEIYPAD